MADIRDDFGGAYKGKKVLVTGHTGFKGGWLCLWLKKLGAKVAGYSLKPPTEPNLFDAVNLKSKVKQIVADVRDRNRLNSVIKEYSPEFVFHLAAQPLVRLSYQNPLFTYETNVMGTINILEVLRNISSARVCIIVTSDKCYANRGYTYGYKETDALGGYDPYSSSKASAELVTSAYRSSFFNPNDYGTKHRLAVSSARAGNVIGGGDWSQDRLIPDCIRFLVRNKTIVIRSPKSTRPWQYVLEPLCGYLQLGALMLKNGKGYSGAWNFGPKDRVCYNVEKLTKLTVTFWGKGKYKIEGDKRFHEAKFLRLNTAKARNRLKWKDVYSVKEALEKTISWYREYYRMTGPKAPLSSHKKYMYEYSVKEIEGYLNKYK